MAPTTATLFPTGTIAATPAALDVLHDSDATIGQLLDRHTSGDWGTVDPEDAHANTEALTHGHRIISSYDLDTETIWIITEADRSVTTILLPDDY